MSHGLMSDTDGDFGLESPFCSIHTLPCRMDHQAPGKGWGWDV